MLSEKWNEQNVSTSKYHYKKCGELNQPFLDLNPCCQQGEYCQLNKSNLAICFVWSQNCCLAFAPNRLLCVAGTIPNRDVFNAVPKSANRIPVRRLFFKGLWVIHLHGKQEVDLEPSVLHHDDSYSHNAATALHTSSSGSNPTNAKPFQAYFSLDTYIFTNFLDKMAHARRSALAFLHYAEH